jgi:hypothetical protein
MNKKSTVRILESTEYRKMNKQTNKQTKNQKPLTSVKGNYPSPKDCKHIGRKK